MLNKPMIIAHRGYSGKYPENTLIAFEKAIDAGCDMIELDVHLTHDEELIVAHDYKLGRTCNGRGFINDFTLKELQLLDAGSWFSREFSNQRFPTLEESLGLINKKVEVNIEIKFETLLHTGHAQVAGDKILNLINSLQYQHKVLISSFDYPMLRIIREKDADIKLGILDHHLKKGVKLALAREINAYSYHPNLEKLNEFHVKSMKENGLKIFSYTANAEKDFKKLMLFKVDGIITDQVEKLRKFFEAL